MTTIAGASRYLAASTLANTRGVSPSTPSVLGDGGMGGANLLDLAYRPNNGIGLSARARAFNTQYLNNAASSLNKILSLGTAEMSTNESIQQAILALRAKIPEGQLSRELRGETTAPNGVDNGAAAASANGAVVDQEA